MKPIVYAGDELMINWDVYPNFSKAEFDCKATGRNDMKPEFLAKLQELRNALGFPLIISSGYRDPSHPVEARKARPGQHAQGIACDILVMDGSTAFKIVEKALELGFTGIGIAQDNRRARTARFVHLDIRQSTPVIWSY